MTSNECFIITECGFKDEVIKGVKELLYKYDYVGRIAEEIPSYNCSLLDYKILKPMRDADFIVVLLAPKDEKGRNANFNVAFEFGWARGIGQNVILLFEGEHKLVPSDIRGDWISLLSTDWKKDFETLLKKEVELRKDKTAEVPDEIVEELEDGITENSFQIFIDMLSHFSLGFRILQNQKIVALILTIFENSNANISKDVFEQERNYFNQKYDVFQGNAICDLLGVIDRILENDKSPEAEKFKEQILNYLLNILKESRAEAIVKKTIKLLIRINNGEAIESLCDFLSNLNNNLMIKDLKNTDWQFKNVSSRAFCIAFLPELTRIRKDINEQENVSKKEFINRMWHQLVGSISDKIIEKNE